MAAISPQTLKTLYQIPGKTAIILLSVEKMKTAGRVSVACRTQKGKNYESAKLQQRNGADLVSRKPAGQAFVPA